MLNTMKATIKKDFVLTMDESVKVSQVNDLFSIFRAKKGECDLELVKAASEGAFELSDSLGEWQITAKTEDVEWSE